MKPIGGYFELELKKGTSVYHDTQCMMKSGRSAMHYIFTLLRPQLVFIPYYTCNALLEPFEDANIPYQFYTVNDQLEPEDLPELKPGEYFLYVNYFDIKRGIVARLSEKYKDKLFVDCTQAFFMKGNGISWFFNSCRKFFGVPDGSYVYPPMGVALPVVETKNEAYIYEHLVTRFNGHPGEGYDTYLRNEVLAGRGILGMSTLSEYLLSNINYDEVIKIRRENYALLHGRFKDLNLLDAAPGTDNVPMCYPLLLDRSLDKSIFFVQSIFIPTFWKDVLTRSSSGFETEKKITDMLVPLPTDQRYTTDDMETIHNSLTNIWRQGR